MRHRLEPTGRATRTKRAVLAFTALAMIATACGSDDDEAATTSAATEATSAPDATEGDATTPASNDGSSTTRISHTNTWTRW